MSVSIIYLLNLNLSTTLVNESNISFTTSLHYLKAETCFFHYPDLMTICFAVPRSGQEKSEEVCQQTTDQRLASVLHHDQVDRNQGYYGDLQTWSWDFLMVIMSRVV